MNDISHLLGRIHQTDCLPFMRSLPDKCVDIVACDPPYGMAYESNWYKGDNPFGAIKGAQLKLF
jgi:DNA modification methylase